MATNDEGKYLQVWKKYMPVIRLLLKKAGDQKLQLYRHEFETTGVKNKSGYSFNIEIVNGKVMNKISGVAIAKDLMQSMQETPAVNEWLRGQTLKISMGKSFELKMEKTAPVIIQEASETQQDMPADPSGM